MKKQLLITALVATLFFACTKQEKKATSEAEEAYTQVDSTITHLEGVKSQMIPTDRINLHVLTYREEGIPVLFIHGNFSSATYWEELMVTLPEGYRAIAPDLRGYGWTEDKLVDATKGARDWSDDLFALLDTMKIEKAHIIGWSMGGAVVYQMMSDAPERILSSTLVSPVSPYGFGGTKGEDGKPLFDDFAGSGGGTVNPTFISLINAGDRTDSSQNSPRNIINSFYYFPPFKAQREEDFLTASLQEKTGSEKYPGDFVASENWPNIAPGKYGPINALTPKYMTDVVPNLNAIENKPSVLWVRGSKDMIVADNSFFDLATLGSLGYVPGWPGNDVAPPQPMVSQTRSVLEAYQNAGGAFTEVVIDSTAHSPHIEKPTAFNKAFHAFIKGEEE